MKVEAGGTVREETAARITQAFDAHGVELLNGGAPGARMKPNRKSWVKVYNGGSVAVSEWLDGGVKIITADGAKTLTNAEWDALPLAR